MNLFHSVSQGMWARSLATMIVCPSSETDVTEHNENFPNMHACSEETSELIILPALSLQYLPLLRLERVIW